MDKIDRISERIKQLDPIPTHYDLRLEIRRLRAENEVLKAILKVEHEDKEYYKGQFAGYKGNFIKLKGEENGY